MTDEDRRYYQQRATAEISLADRTPQPMIANIHRQLATAYLARVAMDEAKH